MKGNFKASNTSQSREEVEVGALSPPGAVQIAGRVIFKHAYVYLYGKRRTPVKKSGLSN